MVLPFHGPWENAVVITFTGPFSTKMINIGALQKVTITWHRFSTKNWKGHHVKEYQFVTKHIKRLSFKETQCYQEFNGYRIFNHRVTRIQRLLFLKYNDEYNGWHLKNKMGFFVYCYICNRFENNVLDEIFET